MSFLCHFLLFSISIQSVKDQSTLDLSAKQWHYFPLLSLSGTTIIYCLYYYSFSIHSRDHLAIILNVTVGFLSLLYLVLFLFQFWGNRVFVLIMSYFYAGYQLFRIFTQSFSLYLFLLSSLFLFCCTCSLFHQPVPFFNSPTLLKLLLIFYSLFLFSRSITHPFIQSFNRSIVHRFHPLFPVGHNYYLFLYYSFIFSSGIFFLPEQIRIQSFSVSLCRYDVLSLLNGTK